MLYKLTVALIVALAPVVVAIPGLLQRAFRAASRASQLLLVGSGTGRCKPNQGTREAEASYRAELQTTTKLPPREPTLAADGNLGHTACSVPLLAGNGGQAMHVASGASPVDDVQTNVPMAPCLTTCIPQEQMQPEAMGTEEVTEITKNCNHLPVADCISEATELLCQRDTLEGSTETTEKCAVACAHETTKEHIQVDMASVTAEPFDHRGTAEMRDEQIQVDMANITAEPFDSHLGAHDRHRCAAEVHFTSAKMYHDETNAIEPQTKEPPVWKESSAVAMPQSEPLGLGYRKLAPLLLERSPCREGIGRESWRRQLGEERFEALLPLQQAIMKSRTFRRGAVNRETTVSSSATSVLNCIFRSEATEAAGGHDCDEDSAATSDAEEEIRDESILHDPTDIPPNDAYSFSEAGTRKESESAPRVALAGLPADFVDMFAENWRV